MKHHDPNGRVSCDDCERTGKPVGGVSVECVDQTITKRFKRPEGWALTHDGALLCSSCAKKADVPASVQKRDRPLVLDPEATRGPSPLALFDGEQPLFQPQSRPRVVEVQGMPTRRARRS